MRGVDLETVPNQLGTAVLRLADGALLHRTGQMDSPEGAEAARALYQILLDAGVILRGHKDDALRRIAVQFKSFQYVLTASRDEVFIVKKTADDTRG